jgi:hypothetical protein
VVDLAPVVYAFAKAKAAPDRCVRGLRHIIPTLLMKSEKPQFGVGSHAEDI